MVDKHSKVKGVSYIENPESNTALYASKKFESKLCKLEGVSGCLVFVEHGIEPPNELLEKHHFEFCENPVLEYTKFVRSLADEVNLIEKEKKYTLTPEGYYIGEDVVVGSNVYIEPGVLIGHGVVIGDNTQILAGAVVKHASIEENCLIKEMALIGLEGFFPVEDEVGNNTRLPCLGRVSISNDVEVGSFTTICRGSNTDTFIGHHVKIDDHVRIGHDGNIGANTVITAGAVLAGYVTTGEHVRIGLNATVKHMTSIINNAEISMGARVARDVTSAEKLYGIPRSSASQK